METQIPQQGADLNVQINVARNRQFNEAIAKVVPENAHVLRAHVLGEVRKRHASVLLCRAKKVRRG